MSVAINTIWRCRPGLPGAGLLQLVIMSLANEVTAIGLPHGHGFTFRGQPAHFSKCFEFVSYYPST